MRFSVTTILVVVALAGLAYSGYQSYNRGTVEERARACCANLNLIDQYVAVWESRNVPLEAGRDGLSLELDQSGRIVRASPGFERYLVQVRDPAQRLTAGSDALAQAAHDPDAFRCPDETGPWAPLRSSSVDYTWQLSPVALPELNGRTRGAACVHNGTRAVARAPKDRHVW